MAYSANVPLQALFDPRPLERSLDRLTADVGELIEEEVRQRTPVATPPPGVSRSRFSGMRGRTPGTLRESWEVGDVERRRTRTGETGRAIEVFTEDPIAPHVEWPTRPHVIRPSAARRAASVVETRRPRRAGSDPRAALRWIDQNGRVRFAPEVHHPGTQGSHMMRDALAEVDGTWVARVGDAEVARWAREQAELVR